MDLDKWIRNRGMKEIKNPLYNKGKNGEPATITVPNIGPENSPLINMGLQEARTGYSVNAKEVEKYNRYGINWSPYVSNIDAQLADAQSGWSKMANALGQTIWSEIALGTLRGFTDLADFVSSNILHLTDADYQNPASEAIQQWQDYYNNEVAPIYTNPDVDIQNGGLTDVGWYAKNIPSIASSLTLFLPGAGATKGLSWLTKASVKGMSIAKATGNARRWLSGVRKGQSFEEMSRAAKFVNNPLMIARANEAAKIGSQALLMRTMENYQEARDVHQQTYQDALDTLSAMDDETYAEWINNNAGILSEGVDPNNRDAVAKDIAKKAADRTFAMDYSNLIFDVIQLYGLKDFGKGMKAITGRGVAAAERQAIGAAEELATGTAAKAVERGVMTRMREYGADVAKDFGKSVLEESTEGIEEAVNAIAQKEGISYGTMLMQGRDDDYHIDGFEKYATLGLGNVINTWRYLQNPMHEYLASPELQESAFWGVIGGLVFGGAASGIQRAQMAYDRYSTKKKLEKLEKQTGEKKNLTDEQGNNWTSLFELPEQKAARLAIQNRILRLKHYQKLLQDLEGKKGDNGEYISAPKDIFAAPDENGVVPDLTGTAEEIAARQAEYRAKIEKQFVSELAMEAMNSGTFDSLLEYFSNDKVKQAMVKIGLINSEDVDNRVESIKKQLQNVQKMYNDNSSHLYAQASYLNATGKEDIPLEYLNIIAKNNTDRMLDLEELDAQLEALSQVAAEEEKNEGKDFDSITHRTHARLQALSTFYGYLRADEEALDRNKDKMSPFEYERRKRHNKNQQKFIIQELASINANNVLSSNETFKPIVNVVDALKRASRYFVPADVEYNEKKGRYDNYLPISFEKSDEDIMKELDKLFSDKWLNNSLWGDLTEETVLHQAKQLRQQIEDSVGNNDSSLAKRNYTLYGYYQQLAALQLQQSMIRDRIVKNTDDIENEVDYYHNSMNEARRKALETASDGIVDLRRKYKDNGKDFMRAIVEAYHRNKTEARRLVESIMSKDDANKFMGYMDIFNFTNNSNNAIFTYLDNLLSELDADDHITDNQVSNDPTSTNESQSTENQPTDNPSSEQQNVNIDANRGQIEPNLNQNRPQQKRDNRPKVRVMLEVTGNGKIVTLAKTNKTTANTVVAYVNPNNTFEIDIRSLPWNKQLKIIRSGLFETPAFDITDANVKVIIAKNPILRYKDWKGNALVIDEQGIIDDANNPRTPIEELQDNNPPIEIAPQSTETTGDTNTQPSSEDSGDVTPPVTTTSEEEPEEQPALFTPGITISTEGATEGSEQSGEAAPISSTGVETETDTSTSDTSQLVIDDSIREKVDSFVGQNLRALIPKKEGTEAPDFVNADIDAIGEQIRPLLYDAIPENIPRELVDEILDQKLNGLKQVKERMRQLDSPIAQDAANLAFQARVEENTSRNFSPLFKATVEAFMVEYNKIVGLPVVDGKQVVRLEDIVRICHQVYDSVDTDTAQVVYNIVKTYLNSKEGSEKYTVLDNDVTDQQILDRIHKSALQQHIDEDSENLDSFRVDIDQLIDRMDSVRGTLDRETWNSLSVGDKVILSFDPHTGDFVIEAENGTPLGYMPRAGRLSDGTFIQSNNSWMTDIKLDSRGNPISKERDMIYHIFTSKDANAVALRNLIIQYALATKDKNKNNALLEDFANNPIIGALELESRRAVFVDPQTGQRDLNAHQWFFVDFNTGDVDYKALLNYLARLYKYNTQINKGLSEKEYKESIRESIDQFYKKLYNTYVTLDNLYNFEDLYSNPVEVPITKLSEANALRAIDGKVDWINDYSLLPYTDEVLVNPEEAAIGITNSSTNTIQFSDNSIAHFVSRQNNSLFLSIDSANRKNTENLPHVDGVWTNDISDHNRNGELAKILAALNGCFSVSILDLVNEPTPEKLDKLYELLLYTIRTSSATSESIVPLLVSKYPRKNILITREKNYLTVALDNDQITIYVNDKGNGKYSIAMVNSDRAKSTPFGKQFDRKNISVNHGEFQGPLLDEGQFTDILTKVVMNFINDNTKINIDSRGIFNDLAKGKKKGFISYNKNGKLSVNIPGGKVVIDYDGVVLDADRNTNAYSKEFDSYGQFLIGNGLIKANVGRINPTDGYHKPTNFQPRSNNQKDNQRLEIGIPKYGDIQKLKGTRSHEHVEKNSDLTLFDNLVSIANSSSHNKGVELMTAMVGKAKVDTLQKIIDELQEKGIEFNIFDLLPKELNYDRDINYYDKDGNHKGVIAVSAAGKKGAKYSIYNEDGRRIRSGRRLNTKTRSNLAVGTLWMNMASSIDVTKDRRSVALRKLIHENLHNKLGENPEAKKVLLDTIENVYGRLVIQFDEDFKNNPEDTTLKDINEILTPYRNPKVNKYIKLEEFLVESLTNSSLYNYLNSIKTNEKLNGEKKSLLNLILDAIIKFFGWTPVRDNTLMAEEVNILKQWTSIVSGNTPIPTIDTEEKSNSENKEKDSNEGKNETPTNEEENETPVTSSTPTTREEETLNVTLGEDGEVDFSGLFPGDDEYNSEENNAPYSIYEENSDIDKEAIQPFVETHLRNLDSASESLPIDIQNNFNNAINNGVISITCK